MIEARCILRIQDFLFSFMQFRWFALSKVDDLERIFPLRMPLYAGPISSTRMHPFTYYPRQTQPPPRVPLQL